MDRQDDSKAQGAQAKARGEPSLNRWAPMRMPFAAGVLVTLLSASLWLAMAPASWGSGGWVACIVVGAIAAAAVRAAGPT